MPTTRRSRTLAAAADDIWRVVGDTHRLPAWWPRVDRVEGVDDRRFTQVMTTDRGRTVRADFTVVEHDPPRRRAWEQDVLGTPFERIMHGARTEVELEPAGDGTAVTIAVSQRMRGFSRLGGWMVKRATRRVLDGALDGLERATGAA